VANLRSGRFLRASVPPPPLRDVTRNDAPGALLITATTTANTAPFSDISSRAAVTTVLMITRALHQLRIIYAHTVPDVYNTIRVSVYAYINKRRARNYVSIVQRWFRNDSPTRHCNNTTTAITSPVCFPHASTI